jgi:hypothetical protein
MSVHNWKRVKAGIFHDFHHAWIEEIKRILNGGVLPEGYYALAEQYASGFGPDVLTLQGPDNEYGARPVGLNGPDGGTALLVSPPQVELTAETEMEFYRRKQSTVVVRHVTEDDIVAVVEVVSPGNKAGRAALQSFVDKAAYLLDQRIHLLILDLQSPTRRDPQGIHGAIWEEITGEEYTAPAGKPLTLAAYESGLTVRAYVQPIAVGDQLTDMPLFLEPGAHVLVPLESTYERAFAAVPRRWRTVLEEA